MATENLTLKIKDLMDFNTAYQEIQNEKMSISLAYKLSRISKEIQNCIEFYQNRYNDYLETYAEKEEDGTFKMTANQNGFMLKYDTISEARESFKELDNYEFPITVEKIPLKALEKFTISPSALTGLLPFIEDN